MQEFMKKKRNFLVYLGSVGIGKTYFCSALAEWYKPEFKTSRYWRESDLLQTLRNSMEGPTDYLQVLKNQIDDDFIILDDVGRDGLNEWRKEIFTNFIDERYNAELPTVIISNFTSKDFQQNYHPRICSRLFCKDNILIEIQNGTDYRFCSIEKKEPKLITFG